MGTVLDDVRYALRALARNPGFTVVALLTLALGIGANTTMFSVVNGTLLKSLRFPAPDRLVMVWEGQVDDPKDYNLASLPNYRDWREGSHSFENMAMFDSSGRGYTLGGGSEPEQVSGVRVTASFFATLGVAPALGRAFLPEEETAGRDRVVVLSHGFWTRRFGADPALVGRTIKIDAQDFTVVGVMPKEFEFRFWSGSRELWVPAGYTPGDQSRGNHSFVTFARLKPGLSLGEARTEMDAIGRRLAEQYPDENIGRTVRLQPMVEAGIENLRPVFLALLGVVGLVLLIACVNVANLMLARVAGRHKELAVRCALGAGRGRIVRQLLTESLLLSLLGGALGIFLALGLTSILPEFLPGNLRFIPFRSVERIDVDARVLAFTFGVSCLTGVLFGLAPALTAFRRELSAPLKDTARGSTEGGATHLRHALVASEVALTLVVLAGAGLTIASMARLLGVDPGLDPKNVLATTMSVPQVDLYNGPPSHPRFCQDLEEQVGSEPGVVSVSGIAHLPFLGGTAGRGLTVEGRPDPGPTNQLGGDYSVACPNILRTLGVRLAAGREFTSQDTLGAPGVVLINESMARRFWPGEDAVGRRMKMGRFDSDAPWLTVVGVYRDMRYRGLAESSRQGFLRPYPQAGWPSMTLVVKTASAPRSYLDPVKKALARVEPEQAVSRALTLEEVVAGSLGSRRFPMLLLTGFALVALALAAVGIAGVVSYSVVQRTREIGIRVALGGRGSDILRLVVGGSMAWAMAGVGLGIGAALGLLRYLDSLLFGVQPGDPVILGAVSLVLVVVALGASYLPARRAARIDPMVALRCE